MGVQPNLHYVIPTTKWWWSIILSAVIGQTVQHNNHISRGIRYQLLLKPSDIKKEKEKTNMAVMKKLNDTFNDH
jgi:hypothetical protein